MKQTYKTLLLWVVLISLGIFVSMQIGQGSSRTQTISYSEFRKKIDENVIQSVEIHPNLIEGEFRDKGGRFQTAITPSVVDSAELEKIRGRVDDIKMVPEEENSLLFSFLVNGIPILLLVVLFFLFMRQLQSGGGKAMSFGKSKAKLLSENNNRVTFADVAGIEEAKAELEEIIEFLRDPKKFTRLGGRIPKGVLLMGSPGTGKTLMAKAIAGEAGVPFYSISGSDFVEMFVGVGASRVRDLFEQGKKNAPCIIFIDEIDAVGRHRGAGLGGGHDEREQTLNQLLVEMDGFESNEGVILVAATNRPDVLDPALQRPGRFDRRIVVPRPDVRGREGILKVHTKRTPLGDNVNINALARGTPGFSGADLENLVNEAALIAARSNKDRVDMYDFENAKDKVLMGPERRSMFLTEEEKRHTAYHEAGHTLVGMLLPGSERIHKVTIIPRGMALGLTQQLPEKDQVDISRDQAIKKIAMMMGGRVADELIFGDPTAGASNDIERATDLARRMVCEWGMSERLGPLAFGKKEGEVFLGREFSQSQDYSHQTAIAIDEEVRRIVMGGYETAKKILSENLEKLHQLADALLEYEVLDSDEIQQVLRGERLTSRQGVSERKNNEKETREPSKKPSFFGSLTPMEGKLETGNA